MLRNLLHRSAHSITWTCSCSHDQQAHDHYRPGDDCGFAACGCAHFQRAARSVAA